jgi:type II secretory pathway pseudopilin PulG
MSRPSGLHPSSFILHPSRSRSRRGITLLEVLVSLGVLSVGLLGVAALIPLGGLLMRDAVKSDRTGACGRAAIHDVKVRRLLDPTKWSTTPSTNVFVIDPLGETATPTALTGPLGGASGPLQRINLAWATSSAIADSVFRWHDDLSYVRAKDYKPAPAPNGDRPVMVTAVGGVQQYIGEFSWFLTVAPASSPQGLYAVSVVVCDGRPLSAAGETVTTAANPVTIQSGPIGYGGVTISITGTAWPANWTLKANDWILLSSVDSSGNIIQATWYRVASVGYDATLGTNITLVGPDWQGGDVSSSPARTFTAVSVNRVTGVYTTTMQLDNDPIWSK